jgi:hypothetical protein
MDLIVSNGVTRQGALRLLRAVGVDADELTREDANALVELIPAWKQQEATRRAPAPKAKKNAEEDGWPRGLIPAVGERRSSSAVTIDANKELADERRRQKEQRKQRKCLRCQKVFLSDGPGNRLCNPCGGYFARADSNMEGDY